MANNPILYNAALSGASGALSNERWITSTNSSEYEPLEESAEAFADAIDVLIAPGGYTDQDANLLQAICENVLSGRGSWGVTVTNSEAIVTCFNRIRTALDPAGGGGSSSPLRTGLYVDANTLTPIANRNGAIGSPFADLDAAYIAAKVVLANISISPTLLIAAGSYAGFTETDGINVNLQGIPDVSAGVSQSIITGNLVSAGATNWNLEKLVVDGTITTTDHVTAVECTLNGAVTCATATLLRCETVADITITGTIGIRDCPLVTLLTTGFASAVFATNSTITQYAGDATFGSIEATWCSLGISSGTNATLRYCRIGDVTISGALNVQYCSFDPNSTITCDDLNIDSATYNTAIENGCTFNIGGTLAFTDGPLSITLQILVPAVAADAVGYVNTTLVGTALENRLAVNDPVVVCPQSDLVAAGAGGGFINARISAANTLRCAFNGALAGGNANFTVARVR